MSTAPLPLSAPGGREPVFPRRPPAAALELIRRAWRANPPLALVGLGMLVLLVLCVVGLVADPRVITGAPAWLKPAKFAVSFGVYALTLVWFLSFVRGQHRLVATISWSTAAFTLLEVGIIAFQAGRGTTSHFNVGMGQLNFALFLTMAVAVGVIWIAGVAAVVLLLRQRVVPPALAMALRLGLVASLIGMALAMPMFGVPPQFGDRLSHAVGAADGGPGLPIVGWSTEAGDLRIGHFVGLHAMQGLPLLGFALARFSPRWLAAGRQAALVAVAGLAWIALSLLLTWQALRAQPVTGPDALTLGALGALLAVAAVAMAAIVLPARSAAG